MSYRNREHGNIVGFVLVGVLLAALLVGGIYFVRHNMAKTDTTTGSTATSNTSDTSDSSDKSSNSTSSSSSNTSDQQLKDALAEQSAAEQKAKEQQQAQNNNSTATTSTNAELSTTSSTATASNLPKTGPEDAITPLVGAVLLTAVGLSYFRSRKLI